ncbi:hypothetical protein V1477_017194 [Vespula maculifrons]|uniref:Uncharacterized protein n=1 Tax=Vespula maculifrons TaxID=7453 RepID=A0ABD2B5B0_VESMC
MLEQKGKKYADLSDYVDVVLRRKIGSSKQQGTSYLSSVLLGGCFEEEGWRKSMIHGLPAANADLTDLSIDFQKLHNFIQIRDLCLDHRERFPNRTPNPPTDTILIISTLSISLSFIPRRELLITAQ